ncbi:MAG TPA: hypothetical protein VMH36_25260 [Alphaproteobacteria bacterium]|nr:hypothetical protein [Alphaproteobacteria bacterium]
MISAKRQLADGERVDDAFSARQDRGNGRSGPSIVPETIDGVEAAPAKWGMSDYTARFEP